MVTNYDYYKKYIKYKNKYLQYKHNLRGGIPNLEPQSQPLAVVILASHQNAIGELLNMMVEGYSLGRKKIKNCACLEISKVVSNDKAEVQVRMVYEGELDPKDTSKDPRLYFTVDEFNKYNYKFKDEHNEKIGLNVKLLLVRHGNGPHNAKTGFLGAIVKLSNLDIYTDPLLTQLGIEQAQRAYQPIMNTILGYNTKCRIFLCSSRLRRAIQTVGIIGFHIFHNNLSEVNTVKEIMVVPGVEEIVDDTGNTENTLLSSGLNPENRSICPIGDYKIKNCDNLFISYVKNSGSYPISVKITNINFNSYNPANPINPEIIPVNFINMHTHIGTIFPLTKRFETAFDVLRVIVQPSPQ